MKAIITASLIALATVTGIAAAQAKPTSDVCELHSYSLHGVWDCR